MITYIPFLKIKGNEINAIGELAPNVRKSICPFFDYPFKPKLDAAVFRDNVEMFARSFDRHIGKDNEFYLDNYDLNDALTVGQTHNYYFLIDCFSRFPVIPVVSTDRSSRHISAVSDLKTSKVIKNNVIAFRATPEIFEEYNVVRDEIDEELGSVFSQFEEIDLILDCRVCSKLDSASTATEIANFSKGFCSDYRVRRVVVTGSSIPASVGDILKTQAERIVQRRELEIYRATMAIHKHQSLIYGDYTTVSPNYSDLDVPPEVLQNVMTAKFTYTFGESHFFIRGQGLKTKGRNQYFKMAEKLCAQEFFRGENYSSGDQYFFEKSRGAGKNCGPNTVIKPSVNTHISYIILDQVF